MFQINSDDGIRLYSSSSNTLINNTVLNNNYGIKIESSAYTDLTNNTVNSNDICVYLRYPDCNTIINTTAIQIAIMVFISMSYDTFLRTRYPTQVKAIQYGTGYNLITSSAKIKFKGPFIHYDTPMRGKRLAGSNGNRKIIFSSSVSFICIQKIS
ncbi:MAG: hypothetical protein FE048_01415 [Thermoplasmata archaeon]|nr:MAG: hypothetical protein FE048_01415 [Thermoplasmata archaeon]